MFCTYYFDFYINIGFIIETPKEFYSFNDKIGSNNY